MRRTRQRGALLTQKEHGTPNPLVAAPHSLLFDSCTRTDASGEIQLYTSPSQKTGSPTPTYSRSTPWINPKGVIASPSYPSPVLLPPSTLPPDPSTPPPFPSRTTTNTTTSDLVAKGPLNEDPLLDSQGLLRPRALMELEGTLTNVGALHFPSPFRHSTWRWASVQTHSGCQGSPHISQK